MTIVCEASSPESEDPLALHLEGLAVLDRGPPGRRDNPAEREPHRWVLRGIEPPAAAHHIDHQRDAGVDRHLKGHARAVRHVVGIEFNATKIKALQAQIGGPT
ncbi:MAG: hypothetical protein ACRDPC_23755 [Solirubrobacteraceae bacterium]